MRREFGVHACACCRARSRSRMSAKTFRAGMPLPSANSRREISMSRERFTRSRYDWHREMMSSCCSYSEMFMTTVVARPFCVMNRGRCVCFVRSRQSLKVRRYSVKGMTSSLIFGRGKVFSTKGMTTSPIDVSNSVPNYVLKVNDDNMTSSLQYPRKISRARGPYVSEVWDALGFTRREQGWQNRPREPSVANSATTRRGCDILSADNLTALRSAQYWLTGNLENSKWEPRCGDRAFWARFSFRESHRAFPGPPVKHEGENAPSFSPECNQRGHEEKRT